MKKQVAFILLTLASFSFPAFAANPYPDEADVKCEVALPHYGNEKVVLTSAVDKFYVKEHSVLGKAMETVYEKSDISLFIRPIEVPVLDCAQEDGTRVTLWEQSAESAGKFFAEVNGRFFELANGTAVNNND